MSTSTVVVVGDGVAVGVEVAVAVGVISPLRYWASAVICVDVICAEKPGIVPRPLVMVAVT